MHQCNKCHCRHLDFHNTLSRKHTSKKKVIRRHRCPLSLMRQLLAIHRLHYSDTLSHYLDPDCNVWVVILYYQQSRRTVCHDAYHVSRLSSCPSMSNVQWPMSNIKFSKYSGPGIEYYQMIDKHVACL